ncbi:MAG: hypothetical protein KatS3mg038_2613 [Candidatus Kapaibacterium sp.]|nr:MAG: hypothetical protein KatS3mg038_2613 [Candidatus Kapabacteria bacterium]
MRARVAASIAGLAVVFGRDPSETLISAYVWALDDLAEEEVEQAVKRALRECRTMPTPAELRELAGVRRPEDQALVAWETAMRAVQRAGFYKSPDFADALINATIHNLGGWRIFVQRCDDPEGPEVPADGFHSHVCLLRALRSTARQQRPAARRVRARQRTDGPRRS